MKYQMSGEQKQAIDSDATSLVVVAGAGSGKTEVVARRVERVLTKGSHSGFRVLALSYTVKAADELRERLRSRLGDLHKRADTDTLHGFAFDLLRKQGTRIDLPQDPEILVRDEDRVELLNTWLANSGRTPLDNASQVFKDLDLARAERRSHEYLLEWNKALVDAGALDYPAMIDRACDLIESSRWVQRHLRSLYRHIVVDEAQNLSASQYQLLLALLGANGGKSQPSCMLLGDERQSIIEFAGGDPRLISQFESDYQAERIELTINFRSSRRIVQLGNRVAASIGLSTRAAAGVEHYSAQGEIELKQLQDEESEGAYVTDWIAALLEGGLPSGAVATGESVQLQADDIAILARSATGLLGTQRELESRKIRFAVAVSEEDWLTTDVAKLGLELLTFRVAPQFRSTARRIAELCGVSTDAVKQNVKQVFQSSADESVRLLSPLFDVNGLSQYMQSFINLQVQDQTQAADWLADAAQIENAWLSFVDRASEPDRVESNFRHHVSRMRAGDSAAKGVRLSTVHKAQGREFKAVAIVGLNEGQFPDFRATNKQALESELRCLYVAVTRPSRSLLVTRPLSRMTRFGPRASEQSSFWTYIESD